VPERAAFIAYIRALDDWRVLPMRDPGLPRQLLRIDWAGDEAAALIERVVTDLDAPALAHFRAAVATPRPRGAVRPVAASIPIR
jgi:phenylacetic acid degradation operon negative regulatory protein